MNLTERLHELSDSVTLTLPEDILILGLCTVVIAGLMLRKHQFLVLQLITLLTGILSIACIVWQWPGHPVSVFSGMLRLDDYSSYWKILADTGAILMVLITGRGLLQKPAEYFFLVLTTVLGAHTLVMSMNFITVVLSLEIVSLCSYALAGWHFNKAGTEGSLKYFLFGSVATASMLYGMSLLYGMAGTLDFASESFVKHMMTANPVLLLVAGLLTLAGFLFKMGSAPMHFWTPDVYQSAPLPVVAFLSVVPKLAGLAALIKFILAINLFGQSTVNWPLLMTLIAAQSITFGNFSALKQTAAKRMLAYSTIAQAGFLLVGVVPISLSGVHASMFYGAILLLMNFLTFHCLQQYERDGISTISSFTGLGRSGSLRSIALTFGLISLVGLPVTAGFSAKLFVFSGLWESYSQTSQATTLVLLIFGLINTVISLFYYLRIPYFLFLREPVPAGASEAKMPVGENLLSVILVLLLLTLFFRPDLLMRWIIKVNFVL